MWLHHSNNGHDFDFLQNWPKEKKKVGQDCGLGREDLLLYILVFCHPPSTGEPAATLIIPISYYLELRCATTIS
jgi:hypothetical protein